MLSWLAIAEACATSSGGRESGKERHGASRRPDARRAALGLVADLIAEKLRLHRLWLEPDPERWLAEWGPRIRAIASSGPRRRSTPP